MADVYYALNGGGLTGSPPDPAITEPPEVYNRDILKRQNVGTYDVCGYYSIPGQCKYSNLFKKASPANYETEVWVVNYCYYSGVSTTTCATRSSHIGCDGYIKTRCFTSLTCTSTSSDELCWWVIVTRSVVSLPTNAQPVLRDVSRRFRLIVTVMSSPSTRFVQRKTWK